jgi:hypothetical protein
MPDGPHPTGPGYDDDFYAWTQYQAEVLRSLPTNDNRFDREHLAEEIEDLGKSERNAVRSEVRRILEHFLKLAYSRASGPRPGWKVSIANARAELEDKLTATLRKDVETEFARLYSRARSIAAAGLQEYREASGAQALPAVCPYTVEQVLAEDWYPEPPGEAT